MDVALASAPGRNLTSCEGAPALPVASRAGLAQQGGRPAEGSDAGGDSSDDGSTDTVSDGDDDDDDDDDGDDDGTDEYVDDGSDCGAESDSSDATSNDQGCADTDGNRWAVPR